MHIYVSVWIYIYIRHISIDCIFQGSIFVSKEIFQSQPSFAKPKNPLDWLAPGGSELRSMPGALAVHMVTRNPNPPEWWSLRWKLETNRSSVNVKINGIRKGTSAHPSAWLLCCRNKQSGNPSVMATWRQTSTCLVSTNSSSSKLVCVVVAALHWPKNSPPDKKKISGQSTIVPKYSWASKNGHFMNNSWVSLGISLGYL